MSPAADKYLNPDGSVTTMAGEIIIPADPERAKEYDNRVAAAAKYLLPNGSVVSGLPVTGGGDSGGGVNMSGIWIGTRTEYNALPAINRSDPAVVHFIREGT